MDFPYPSRYGKLACIFRFVGHFNNRDVAYSKKIMSKYIFILSDYAVNVITETNFNNNSNNNNIKKKNKKKFANNNPSSSSYYYGDNDKDDIGNLRTDHLSIHNS